jgi:predicted RNA-binding protein with RPS1 domain
MHMQWRSKVEKWGALRLSIKEKIYKTDKQKKKEKQKQKQQTNKQKNKQKGFKPLGNLTLFAAMLSIQLIIYFLP